MISVGLTFSENDWPFNVDEITREYIEKYCPVEYDTIIDAAREVRNEASHYSLNFGSAVSGQDKYME